MKPAIRMWRRTPPAIFPPALGFLGLGLAWRGAEDAFAFPLPLGEALLGAGTLLFLFMLLAWTAKPLRRPGVVLEELRVVPGRAGVSAMTMGLMLSGAVLAPYAPGTALGLTLVALTAHSLCALLIVHVLLSGPPEQRGVTPVWHLTFVGFIVAAFPAIALGLDGLALALLLVTGPVAVVIWAVSLWQLWRRIPPAPLRPLLAIHLAPPALFATVAAQLEMPGPAQAAALLGGVILLALLAAARWIAVSGFTPLWGAFTFPLAAFAGALMHLGEGRGALGAAAAVALVAATLIIPLILGKVVQGWLRGSLADQTNAATV